MTFRFDKLTIKAQEAVAAAQNLASSQGNPTIESVHLLSALLDEQDGPLVLLHCLEQGPGLEEVL